MILKRKKKKILKKLKISLLFLSFSCDPNTHTYTQKRLAKCYLDLFTCDGSWV